jgi:hypothetical protein
MESEVRSFFLVWLEEIRGELGAVDYACACGVEAGF